MFQSHPRAFQANRYVYPVLSRRAGGVSIGVNLNRDNSCNFNCVYCQVQRAEAEDEVAPGNDMQSDRTRAACATVDLVVLRDELDAMIGLVTSGTIYDTLFRDTPAALRRLNDIALSGDGEPTACLDFGDAVDVCAEARHRHGLDEVKLVLITNASLLHRDPVRRALAVLDANNGEIWAKLDAGSEEFYRRVARSRVPYQRILTNLRAAAQARPVVIQSLFMRIDGQPPAPAEIEAYCDRLSEVMAAGGQIKLVQIHTVARPPAESWISALSNVEVDALAELVRHRTGLPVAAFYGS